jgi:hypothetical protein
MISELMIQFNLHRGTITQSMVVEETRIHVIESDIQAARLKAARL